MTPAELAYQVRRLDAAMEKARYRMAMLGRQRASVIAQLAEQVGATEAARRLGMERTSVHRVIRSLGASTPPPP